MANALLFIPSSVKLIFDTLNLFKSEQTSFFALITNFLVLQVKIV